MVLIIRCAPKVELNIELIPVIQQGRTNNLAHPCIEKLCVTFFYTGKKSLARLFPDDFMDTIPEKAVALVMTCVCDTF